MDASIPQNVIAICLFGSMAREDNDDLSDADILVVVENRSGKIPEKAVINFVRPSVDCTPSISWYGRERLQTMFVSGHLFAWHLYYEARVLWGGGIIAELFGRPSSYVDAQTDIASFRRVISGIPIALRQCPGNAIYEMGLLYVCVRNIAMSASWHLRGRPDFTRYSPFNLNSYRLGISRVDYDLMMSCRMASQRGLTPSGTISSEKVIQLQSLAGQWSEEISEAVRKNDI